MQTKQYVIQLPVKKKKITGAQYIAAWSKSLHIHAVRGQWRPPGLCKEERCRTGATIEAVVQADGFRSALPPREEHRPP